MINTEVIWDKSLDFWNNPEIEDPEFYFDSEHADQAVGQEEIAHFDMVSRKARFHMPNLKRKVGLRNTESIVKHEIGHYEFCPYDLKTCLILINEADRVLKNKSKAKFAENIFADILLNTRMVQKGDPSIINTYKAMGCSDDPFWNLYMRTYELVWNIPPQSLSRHLDADTDAQELTQIVQNCINEPDSWPRAMRAAAKIFKKYEFNQDREGKSNGKSNNNSNHQGRSKSKSTPLIDHHEPKDFLPCKVSDPQGQGEIEKSLSGISSTMKYGEFKRVTGGEGLFSGDIAKKIYHLDIARHFEINPPVKETYSGSELPERLAEWLPEDELQHLDVEASLYTYGRIIPGETTLQRKREQGVSGQRAQTYLDVLLVIDSSGSMPDPSSELSIPIISALSLAHSALKRRAKVGVVNFSSNYTVTEYTHKKSAIDNALLHYQGGGTIIPGNEMLKMVKSNQREQYILIITDTCISDLQAQLLYLRKAREKAAGGTIFLFGNQNTAALEQIGYTVRNATSEQDIINLTRQLNKDLYG